MTVEAPPGRLARLRPVVSIWDARRRERALAVELNLLRARLAALFAEVRALEGSTR